MSTLSTEIAAQRSSRSDPDTQRRSQNPPDPPSGYIHGTHASEQSRLAALNELSNADFIRFLDLGERDHVLEVGSGLGILTRAVAARLPGGMVWGIEQSVEQIEFALQQLDQLPESSVPNVTFVQGDAHALPFADGCFQVAYCRYVLEHIKSPLRALEEMRRVLQPGGRVFVQEPNIYAVEIEPECPTFDAVWRRFGVLQEQLGGDPLVGKRLLGLLRRAGFTEVSLSIAPVVGHAGMETFPQYVAMFADVLRAGEPLLEAHGLPRREVRAGVAELEALLSRDDAALFFYWHRATALRPPAGPAPGHALSRPSP
jgi:ubiquinone/menaquinone biosynthesis C-methylase UbiE